MYKGYQWLLMCLIFIIFATLVICAPDEREHIHIKVLMSDANRKHKARIKTHHKQPQLTHLQKHHQYQHHNPAAAASPPYQFYQPKLPNAPIHRPPIEFDFYTESSRPTQTPHQSDAALLSNYGPVVFDNDISTMPTKQHHLQQQQQQQFMLNTGSTAQSIPLNSQLMQQFFTPEVISALKTAGSTTANNESEDYDTMDSAGDAGGGIDGSNQHHSSSIDTNSLMANDFLEQLQREYLNKFNLATQKIQHERSIQAKMHKRKKYGSTGIGEDYHWQPLTEPQQQQQQQQQEHDSKQYYASQSSYLDYKQQQQQQQTQPQYHQKTGEPYYNYQTYDEDDMYDSSIMSNAHHNNNNNNDDEDDDDDFEQHDDMEDDDDVDVTEMANENSDSDSNSINSYTVPFSYQDTYGTYGKPISSSSSFSSLTTDAMKTATLPTKFRNQYLPIKTRTRVKRTKLKQHQHAQTSSSSVSSSSPQQQQQQERFIRPTTNFGVYPYSMTTTAINRIPDSISGGASGSTRLTLDGYENSNRKPLQKKPVRYKKRKNRIKIKRNRIYVE